MRLVAQNLLDRIGNMPGHCTAGGCCDRDGYRRPPSIVLITRPPVPLTMNRVGKSRWNVCGGTSNTTTLLTTSEEIVRAGHHHTRLMLLQMHEPGGV
jgi:hypothetical protein